MPSVVFVVAIVAASAKVPFGYLMARKEKQYNDRKTNLTSYLVFHGAGEAVVAAAVVFVGGGGGGGAVAATFVAGVGLSFAQDFHSGAAAVGYSVLKPSLIIFAFQHT